MRSVVFSLAFFLSLCGLLFGVETSVEAAAVPEPRQDQPAVNYYVYVVLFLILVLGAVFVLRGRTKRRREIHALCLDQRMPDWFLKLQRQSQRVLDIAGASPFGYVRIADRVVFQKLGTLPDGSAADAGDRFRLYEIEPQWRSDAQTVIEIQLTKAMPRFSIKPLGGRSRRAVCASTETGLHADLAEKIVVSSPDEAAFQRVFSPALQAYLLQAAPLTLICSGERLFCFAYADVMGADELKAALSFLQGFLDVLAKE